MIFSVFHLLLYAAVNSFSVVSAGGWKVSGCGWDCVEHLIWLPGALAVGYCYIPIA